MTQISRLIIRYDAVIITCSDVLYWYFVRSNYIGLFYIIVVSCYIVSCCSFFVAVSRLIDGQLIKYNQSRDDRQMLGIMLSTHGLASQHFTIFIPGGYCLCHALLASIHTLVN